MEKHEKFYGFEVTFPDGSTFGCGGLTLADATEWIEKWKTKPNHKVRLVNEAEEAKRQWAKWDEEHPQEK